MPPNRDIDFSITVEPGTKLIFIPPYRMTQSELKELNEQLHDMLSKGFIWSIMPPWGAFVLFLKKKYGSMHISIDYL